MIPFPNKKYKIILADPPWEYNRQDGRSLPYEWMTDEQIFSMPVNEISDNDCVLFLWVVSAKIDIGLETIKRWGFNYKTIAFTWVKTTKENKIALGMGNWTRSNVELCLLATKGKPKRENADVNQVVLAERKEHSKKPNIFRTKILRLMGDMQPRIELFARTKIHGWDTWGNDEKLKLEPLENYLY